MELYNCGVCWNSTRIHQRAFINPALDDSVAYRYYQYHWDRYLSTDAHIVVRARPAVPLSGQWSAAQQRDSRTDYPYWWFDILPIDICFSGLAQSILQKKKKYCQHAYNVDVNNYLQRVWQCIFKIIGKRNYYKQWSVAQNACVKRNNYPDLTR